ncbi:hypothetical protein AB0C28_51020 [Nonomuraea sp. NPDC048892]|uniref:hypothetical protein n=1 Tax=Nonomuraea sp. NPDC048892 TaxID=3154624 RepID=UPI0033CA9A5C
MQGELYLGEPGGDAQVAKIREGEPDGWMFNGIASGYDHAPLRAEPGERGRIWAVAAGPSSGTALHVVGAPFDTVYKKAHTCCGPMTRRGAGARPDSGAGRVR